MNGIKITQVRVPIELYELIKETAYQKRQSVNKTIIELIENIKNKGDIRKK